VDFDALGRVNEGRYRLAYIKDTFINYPLMAGVDNFKYLEKSYDGKYSAMGSLFLDFATQTIFRISIRFIYGHNMKNGSMFGGLRKYKSQEYFEAHRNFYIYTPEKVNMYEVFSAYTTDAYGFTYDFEFSVKRKKNRWLGRASGASVCILRA
jgi:sortase B